MQIIKQDEMLDALIDLFNEQMGKRQWDEAYGTSVAIAEHYEMRAQQVRDSVVAQLKIGVVNRAKAAAEEKVAKRKKKA